LFESIVGAVSGIIDLSIVRGVSKDNVITSRTDNYVDTCISMNMIVCISADYYVITRCSIDMVIAGRMRLIRIVDTKVAVFSIAEKDFTGSLIEIGRASCRERV